MCPNRTRPSCNARPLPVATGRGRTHPSSSAITRRPAPVSAATFFCEEQHHGQQQRLRSALVQGRHHLRTARQGLLRQKRRRRRRFSRTDRQARLHQGPGRHRHLALALLPLAAEGRRLRHRRLPGRAPGLRHPARLPPVRARGPQPRPQGDHRAGGQPHLGPAPLVPGGPPGQARVRGAPLLRVERHGREVPGDAHHLHRHRDLQLGLGPGGRGLLLAPLLQPPAGSEPEQPAGGQGGEPHPQLLAGHRRGRPAPGRGALPVRARGHEQRKPARDARGHPRDSPRDGQKLHGPDAARRGQPVARGHGRLLR